MRKNLKNIYIDGHLNKTHCKSTILQLKKNLMLESKNNVCSRNIDRSIDFQRNGNPEFII